MTDVEVRHFHLFSGLGGGAAGFNRGEARVGNLQAKFRCLGGIDVNTAAIADFNRLAGVPGTVLDLFSREQYVDFHGHEPPAGWREATLDDIRRAAGGERPNIVFTSPPCKGLSGLLSESRSKTDRYQALNRLTLRGIWLSMEAWADDPPEFVILENVPRIQSRGRHLLDQIGDVLRSYGYAVAETTHDCGELGGLAQSRKRFLLVARHTGKISPFLYEPHKRPLRAVGDMLGRMPLPGDPTGGPMHRVPRLQWKTWVRLAFVRAGSDWRSLNALAVKDGILRDYLIVPDRRRDFLGVTGWDETGATVSARGLPTNGRYSVADPRACSGFGGGGKYIVTPFDSTANTVIAGSTTGNGAFAVSDPRFHGHEYGQYGVLPWHEHTGAVSGQSKPGGGNYSVADPRPTGPIFGKYAVTPWGECAGTVISGNAQGAYAVADPRPGLRREHGDHYLTAGHYGVVPWASPSGAVTASTGHDNGYGSVADPRVDTLPAANENLVAVIRALDGTWHRPFTTLELAALQGLVDPEEQLELDGLSDIGWRERIGNAVPPPAAQAIASVMGHALLLAWSGETFSLGSTPIWVRPVAVALAVRGGDMSTIHVVSVSGGKDSTATLLLALERCPAECVVPIFCDTGNEHAEVHEYLAYLEQALDISILRLKADFSERIAGKRRFIANDHRTRREYETVPVFEADGVTPVPKRDGSGRIVMRKVRRHGVWAVEPVQKTKKIGGGRKVRWTNKAKRRALAVLRPSGNPFLDLCMWKGRFPSRTAQFCTEELKRNIALAYQIDLIDSGHQVVSWQGVRRDESQNRRHAKKIERIGPGLYAFRPLVEWTAKQVFGYCGSKGLQPNPLYKQGMGRVGCMPCINAGKDELVEISVRFPGHLEEKARWEALVSKTAKRGFSTFFNKELHDNNNKADRRVHEANRVEAVIEWANTGRGGRQRTFFADFIEPAACSSAYGLCE